MEGNKEMGLTWIGTLHGGLSNAWPTHLHRRWAAVVTNLLIRQKGLHAQNTFIIAILHVPISSRRRPRLGGDGVEA